MKVERHEYIDAMIAAADIGNFELVEDIRRRIDLKCCVICVGRTSYAESSHRVLWGRSLLHVCTGCYERRVATIMTGIPGGPRSKPTATAITTWDGVRHERPCT